MGAVITLVVLTNLLVAFGFGWIGQQQGLTLQQSIAARPLDSWLWVSLGVIGLVGVASLYKYLSLQGGGRTIAEALGGHLIPANTRDRQQKQLLNIVEEMSIAAGMPVPPVYLIPEPSINAFAAGFNSDDAVIGINQGTLDILNRSELQGVVAHEFSHILNGDTSINLRLIAILHGILFLGMIGYGLMRAGGFSRKNGAPILAIGIGLIVIGYGGTFFGNLIKAAVSRQREYLADASAVQFTRDPSGIADALKKIGGYSAGSYIENEAAEEASHMFFGASAHKFASSLMATHPPLEQRILAIEPNWDGKFPINTGSAPAANRYGPGASAFAGSPNNGTAANSTNTDTSNSLSQSAVSVDSIVASIGTVSHDNMERAHNIIESNDEVLNDAAHDPFEARALIYAMLIDPDANIAQAQLRLIHQQAERGVAPFVDKFLPLIQASDATHQLALLDMSIPSIKALSHPQYKRFMNNCAHLITSDKRVDLFEWVLHRILVKELHGHFEGPQKHHGRISKIAKVEKEAAQLLSIIASHSSADAMSQLAAYEKGANILGIEIAFNKQEFFDYGRLNDALGKLRKLRPLVKPALLKACTATALADQHINSDESALLKGIAATLDCPLPPLESAHS